MLLKNIASELKLELRGDPDLVVTSLAPVSTAAAGQLTFVVNKKFLGHLEKTEASAVILPAALVTHSPCANLISDNPYLSYALASRLLYPDPPVKAGVHSSAVVAATATVADCVEIAACVVVEAGAVIGAGSRISAGCYIGHDAVVGENVILHANVTLGSGCRLGDQCRVQSGAVIGSDGFGFARGCDGWSRIQQVGRVIVGAKAEIGANTTIDRGALDDTVIGTGVILDNQIQIAHNVQIGDYTAIAACVGIAGSTVIGKNCTIGGKSAIVGHLSIADNVHLTATSFVTQSIVESGSYSSGMPLQPTRQWRRTYARLAKLDDLFRSLKKRTD